jgi:DNA-binding CsgD family transcriptional regulator
MKHPLSYELIPEILALPLGFLKALNIHEILYSFTDTSGNRSVLTTTPLLLDINFCKREFMISQDFPCLRLMPDEGSWKTASINTYRISDHFVKFQQSSERKEQEAGLFSVCCFSRNRNKTRENFELYSHLDHPGITHQALANQPILDHAYQLFLDKTVHLRKQIKKEPLVKTFTVPKSEFINIEPIILPPIKKYFFNEISELYLTPQEAQCINLLFQCRSSAQIGDVLGLSPRTVEHYINQVKIKLNCSTKAELYDALRSLGFRIF